MNISGRQTVARSPDENDKIGLLREAEPVDYTAELVEEEYNTDRVTQGYQSSRPGTTNTRYGSSRARPLKGIFDDV